MSIRWSALEVSEAMDEIEALLDQAEPFLAQAEQKAIQATGIQRLPEHMTQRIGRLVYAIEHRQDSRLAVDKVRESIPKGAVETELERSNQLALPH